MTLHKRIWTSPFSRLTVYYLLLAVVTLIVVTLFPQVLRVFSLRRLLSLAQQSGNFPNIAIQNEVPDDPAAGAVESIVATFVAISASLILLIPVVWVYMITKQQKGYDESVVHTVLILPVPVTGLVMVVQFSVALAFSLAGIVAAVRFRNTLDDTKDAVYIFLAIGTALACGAQAVSIAAVATLIFNYLVLIMWRFKIGNIYADQLKRTPKMRLGDVLAGAGGTPGAGSGNLTIGDPRILQALTPDSLAGIAERKARLREHIESAGKEAKKYNGLLVVVAKATEQFLDAIEVVLTRHTSTFKLAEITPTTDGNSTLEYVLGLNDISGPELVDAIRKEAGGHIVAAEFRNLKVRKTKEVRTPYWTLPKE
jgi:Domain of unknown function (DUF4956)